MHFSGIISGIVQMTISLNGRLDYEMDKIHSKGCLFPGAGDTAYRFEQEGR